MYLASLVTGINKGYLLLQCPLGWVGMEEGGGVGYAPVHCTLARYSLCIIVVHCKQAIEK